MNLTRENKNKIVSAACTALFLALVMVICMAFGYDPPDPPIPEEGVEVNVGNSDFGSGDNPMPDASQASSAPRPSSATEQISTQSTESSVPLYSSKKPSTSQRDNQTPTTQQPEPPKEPEINKNAIASGSMFNKGNKNAGSEGNTTGSGNMGKEGGDPNSNRYDGAPGKGGAGFSLAGRSARALPSPNNSTNKEGKVVVKIWVDREGNVAQVSAPEKGSTVTDAGLVNQAKAAAKAAKFSSKPDAPEVQTGTITYVFQNR